ncbi:MAG: DNA polymerase I [Phycisphaerales bacterium]|nr:DNA polymerase I [Phycisphaerales bacterium]
MPTLYLIDGYAQFFRHYHAIRTPMTSPVTKEPTNMTFGFVGMLLKLLRGEGKIGGPPDYIALTLDVSGDKETFRSELYPDYKAHRPPPPEDLFPQVERCLAMLRELGIPILGVEGFEADDVIASLVTKLKARHSDLSIRVISKDKDLKQLLCDPGDPASSGQGCVELYDIHTDQVIDAAKLMEETGLRPAQIIDMLALMGDNVDNVPGVEGVGEKTAAQLVREYGDLDRLLASADSIKGKRGENIRAARDLLNLSRKLVTLRHDAPVDLNLAEAEPRRFHLDRLIPILKELGFNRYQDEVRLLLGKDAVMPDVVRNHAPAPRVAKPAAEHGGLFSGGLFDAVDSSAPDPARPIIQGDYHAVRTAAELADVARAMNAADAIAIDTETTSLSPHDARLCGISIAIKPGQAWYIPVRSPAPDQHLAEPQVLNALRPILEDPAKPKYGHNLKYDLLALRNNGIELRGLTAPGACDGMVASYLIDSARSSHGLDSLALALLGRGKQSISELIGSGKTQRCFDTVPLDAATPYAAADADLAFQLSSLMLPQIRAMGMQSLFHDVELPLVEVLAELEWNGILVDPDELDRQRERLNTRLKELLTLIQDTAMETVGRTFDPDSPRQLSTVLFNKPTDAEPGLGLKSIKKTKTGHSTDAEVLEKLASDATITSPLPTLILEYRQLAKLISTYLVALKEAIHPKTRRVHSSFSQTVAATGRLASSDPNLQNIPIRTDLGREIRRAFIAPPGHVLVTADYSQIELRLLAHLSKDPALTEAFDKGEDIHAAVAAQIHNVPLKEVTKEQRSGAKMVNFGIVYGITAYGLARRLGIGDKEAAEIITGYKRRFAGITTFLEECIAHAKRFGYVETMLKRRRAIPDIESNNPSRRSLAERTAINSVVQGSAADLIKLAMVDLHARLSEHAAHHRGGKPPEIPGVKMLLQIHDELVFEVPEAQAERAKALITDRMEKAMSLTVPLKADGAIGRNWFEGK